MSSNEEVQKPTAAKRPAQAKPKKAKAAPEKKPKAAAKTASHPPYFEMIKEALSALNERGGSSPHAIAKFMEEKHKSVLPANFRKHLGLQLKNSATKGKLIKIKASYKLSESGKKEKVAVAKPAVKKTAAAVKKTAVAAKKPAATVKKTAAKPKTAAKGTTAAVGTKRKAEVVKKVAAKKSVKKATPAKAKQPKSIKSPVAKRAKRATAA